MTNQHPSATVSPRLTVILTVGPQRERGQRAIDSLGSQTLREMEVVLVDIEPDAVPMRHPPGIVIHEIRFRPTGGQAESRMTAIGMAQSPVVAFVEDHSVVSPGWAEAVAAAFESGPWDVVGYTFANANPKRWLARACHAAVYGPWMAPGRDGEVRDVAGNNLAFRLDRLRGLGDRLPGLFFPDSLLRQHMLSQGQRFFVAGSAVCTHEIPEHIGFMIATSHSHGRIMAARRVENGDWGWPRRLLYAAGVPLGAPVLRLGRLLAGVAAYPSRWSAILQGLPIALVIFVSGAIGESQGYLAGAGRSAQIYEDYELKLGRS